MKCAKYLLLYFPGLLHYLRECTCIVATDILVINLRVAQAIDHIPLPDLCPGPILKMVLID